MPSSEQIKLYWLKWIDRQYAKADPSHAKMRPEVSKPGKDAGTLDDAAEQKRTNKVYPVHAITRKSFGDITRKLSVTVLLYLPQCRGTLSRRKSRVASANSLQVA